MDGVGSLQGQTFFGGNFHRVTYTAGTGTFTATGRQYDMADGGYAVLTVTSVSTNSNYFNATWSGGQSGTSYTSGYTILASDADSLFLQSTDNAAYRYVLHRTASQTYPQTFTAGIGAYVATTPAVPAGIVATNGNDVLTRGAGNDTLNGLAGADTMRGGAGNDTYVVDNVGDRVIETTTAVSGIDAGGTDLVRSNVSYALGSFVENLTLLGAAAINGVGNSLNNALTGNSAANRLTGGAGNDSLIGGAGADTLVGGAGNDVYTIDGADTITEAAGEGTDTIVIGASYVLGANFENLTLSGTAIFGGTEAYNGTGNDVANVLTGNTSANSLVGGLGDDTLIGGSGADTLNGGAGNDTYQLDLVDTIIDSGGVDTASPVVSNYVLHDLFENLLMPGTFSGTATGNSGNNVITGNDGNNALYGGGGNDSLNGGNGADTLSGGAGADTLVGGSGNDHYLFVPGDTISESAGMGTDTVSCDISYTLLVNFENLILTGSGAISGTGNALANALTGNAAANTLSGGDGNDALTGGAGNDQLLGGNGNDTLTGGSGNDQLTGGAGNDVYYLEGADTVVEAATGGIDTIHSATSLTLGTGVERLILTGAALVSGTGNGLANLLTGNSAANTLTGNDGNDTLVGGRGNDVLVGGAGVDTASYSDLNTGLVLAVTANLNTGVATIGTAGERDTLQGIENLVGGGGWDTLTGNASANLLEGSYGADVLTGGGGADVFRFRDWGQGADTIEDFVHGVDKIQLVANGFAGITASNLSAVLNATSGTASRLLYYQYNGDGRLVYDSDGVASGGEHLVVTLTGFPALSASDFNIAAS